MGITVGVTRDDRFADHKTGHSHPEHPRRIQELYRMLDREFSGRLMEVKPQPAAMEHVERVHTPAHIRRILKTAEMRMTSLAPDTPVSAMTYMAAWLAAGACLQGVDLLMAQKCRAFFALVRVYYYSTHDLMLYPYSGESGQTGAGRGRGHTMNIPISRDFTDKDMVCLYRNTLLPVIRGFAPDMIMVAAGFDAHRDDPIGRCGFSEHLYFRLTRLLTEGAETGGRRVPTLFALEGGYEPLALVRCVGSVLHALTDDPAGGNEANEPDDCASSRAVDLARQITEIHRPLGVMA
jgi:acetoin utilization deacetylase AcuC-like enzyme